MLLYIIIVLFCQAAISKVEAKEGLFTDDSCFLCLPINLDNDIEFHLYTRQNPKTSYILKLNNESNLANSPLHREHHTVIYIHGFDESVDSESCNKIVKAYLKRNEYNVIVVDWSVLGPSSQYEEAVENSVLVGSHIAHFTKWLENQNRINIPDLHVIGFSLGAHVAGFVGRKLAPQKVGRVTGLDPASLFVKPANRIDKSDATFVDIIHVSSGKSKVGLGIPLGHADFYPNNRLNQPGCENEAGLKMVCNHRRAWLYYAESILNPQGFPASKCDIWEPMLENCTGKVDTFMGFGVDLNSRGIYSVMTNSRPPFATNFDDRTGKNEKYSGNSSAQILSTICQNIILIASFYLSKNASRFLYLNL